WPVGVVSVDPRIVVNAERSRARHNGLKLADLAVSQRVWSASEVVGESPGERQLVQRVNPVCRIVELPIGVTIALLETVIRTHAQLNRYDVGLDVWEAVLGVREVDCPPIDCEQSSSQVVPRAHPPEERSVLRGHRAEL